MDTVINVQKGGGGFNRTNVWFIHTRRFFSAVATASDFEWTRSFP
jgi:hypothetical protein